MHFKFYCIIDHLLVESCAEYKVELQQWNIETDPAALSHSIIQLSLLMFQLKSVDFCPPHPPPFHTVELKICHLPVTILLRPHRSALIPISSGCPAAATCLCDWISEGLSEQSTLSLNFSLGPTEAVHPDAVNWFGKLEYAFNIWIEIDTLNRRPSPLSIPLTSYHPIESISLFIAVPFDFLPSLFHCSTMRSPLIWISEHFAHRWWWQSNGQRYTEKLSRSAVDWMMRSLSTPSLFCVTNLTQYTITQFRF